tara:strand:+ start:3373 stop:5481 length:2109 start_codon:yes stop_codon:yes gene_type:complete
MQELQLYIESDRLDLFSDEAVSLTQTIQNVKQVDKIFTSFSKTFSVPASSNNNKIFKHYYNFNITGGYDARLKKAGRIELNTIPFKSGLIKLEGVELKNNLAHTYRITFFGNTVELPDILGDDKLGSLPFSEAKYNLTYDADTIKEKLEIATGANAEIITPLITHTDALYYNSGENVTDSKNVWFSAGVDKGVYWNQLKFALRLYEIIEQIETKYTTANGYASNIAFSTDFFNTTNLSFYNLYMWLHRKSGAVEPPSQVTTYRSLISGYLGTVSEIVKGHSTIFIPSGLVTPPNRIISGEVEVTNTSGIACTVIVSLNGSPIVTTPFVTGTQAVTIPAMVANGTYSVTIQHEQQLTVDDVTWTIEGITSSSYTDVVNTGSKLLYTDFDFQVSQQIPEVSIMSFLTGLFKMFNLVAYVNDDGLIVVRPLEATSGVNYSYYTSADISGLDAPIDYNISSYVDVTQRKVNIALPYKEIIYAYEGTGSYFAKQHNQLYSANWGALRYIGGTETDGTGGINYNASTEVYKVLVPFEHMKYERMLNRTGGASTTIQWGWSVNETQQAYIGKPLIFYGVRQSGGDALSFRESPTSSLTVSNYWIPSNSLYLASATGKQNINFGVELNEYEDGSDQFTETLFSVYHSEYIIDIFNQSRRITQITSYLPLRIIYNFKLNDTFTINSETYIINSITTDLQSGKSQMELLNKV